MLQFWEFDSTFPPMRDLNTLGLPELDKEVQDLLAKSKNFIESTVVTFLFVFGLSKKDAEKVLNACAWVSKSEKKQILDSMSLDSKDEAQKLLKAKVKNKRGQLKKAAKRMAQR